MEKYITLPTPDGFEIHGVLNWEKKSDKLVVFVHGFTGSISEAHYYCGKEYFIDQGFNVFRFNLYTDGKMTRKLKDCSMKIHAADILTVSQYFQNYDEVYLVGHSLAGPCISTIEQYPGNIKKIIFWDPAFEMRTTGLKIYEDNGKIYYQSSGKHIKISRDMQNEFLDDDFLKILKQQNFDKNNMYAIYADGDRHINNKPTTDEMGIKSYIIEGANHGFTQEGKYKELFEKTLEFIEN